MKFASLIGLFSLSLTLFAWSPASLAAELPPRVVPAGLGVNIHFTDARPGEMTMLAAAGFRWVRMDLTWSSTETTPGKYDFSAYDRLLADMEKHQLRGVWVLDYSHPNYDDNLSPYSDAGRQAFARWAAAAVVHFRGHGILWEMYNEPNLPRFWRPEVNPEAYIQLARTVGQALRKAAPEEIFIGPATSRIDTAFLERCFEGGLLDYWQAVSVHPYRSTWPETVAPGYEALRELIAQYAPGKSIPILAAEWGYSSGWKNCDDTKQGKAFPREYLTNLAHGIPLTIWYDWHDDGEDATEAEYHFGTVAFPYHEGREPVYDPKPAYTAARTLTTILDGFAFQKRLSLGDEKPMVLAFTKGATTRWAAWTTANAPQSVTLPLPAGRYQVTDHLGQPQPPLTATTDGLVLTLSDAPLYLVPEK